MSEKVHSGRRRKKAKTNNYPEESLRRWRLGTALACASIVVVTGMAIGIGTASFSSPSVAQYQPPANDQVTIEEIERLQRSEGLLAFPGARGYAKQATGGRGGRVLTVNTIADVVDANDELLSLREAIEIESGTRTIVFDVGGVFDTSEKRLNLIGEQGSNITVACQTAPAPGVIVRTHGFNVTGGASNIIFRHCAVRVVDPGAPFGESGRSFTVRGSSENVILDHMSFAWATDEGFQAYLAPDQEQGINNFTLSNSVVVEGDADSSHPQSEEHPSWYYHAMGPSCNNNNPTQKLTNCSIVDNFIAHNASRNAMIWGGSGELKNNVIYNWYGIGLTVQPHVGGGVDVIIDNNLMKSGPDTVGATKDPDCGPDVYRCAMYLGSTDEQGPSRFLIGDNYFVPRPQRFKWWLGPKRIEHHNENTPDGKPDFEAATDSPLSVLEMAQQGSRFMTCVGASRPHRDAVDARVIQEFFDGTGSIGIGENDRSGGHNVTAQRTWDVFGDPTARDQGYDSDSDGMPDWWERAYGLDANNGADHSGDLDDDGYTNIEEFLAIAAHC